MESLYNKPVVFVGDAAKRISRHSIDEVIERIKSISGNDEVLFSRKYKSSLSVTLPSRITIAANQTPNLFDDSGALASRLLVLPFGVSFLGREDPRLLDALLTEIEGIAAWALQGLAALNERGRFLVPEISQSEISNIEEAYSPLKQFIEDECSLGGDEFVSNADTYDAYFKWATANREDHILLSRTFMSSFTAAVRGKGCRYGPHRTPEGRKRGYKGLSLRPDGMAAAFKPGLKVVK